MSEKETEIEVEQDPVVAHPGESFAHVQPLDQPLEATVGHRVPSVPEGRVFNVGDTQIDQQRVLNDQADADK